MDEEIIKDPESYRFFKRKRGPNKPKRENWLVRVDREKAQGFKVVDVFTLGGRLKPGI